MENSPAHPRHEREIPRWQAECDVLVVGLGCAGAAATLEADRAGAQVIALERASAGGGTTAMSGGVIYLGGGTTVQKECGFDDSPEEMFKYLMASCGERPDEERIRIYCEHSVEHYHWFVEQGVPFKSVFYPHYSGEPPNDDGLVFSGSENVHPYNEIARPAARGHVPQIDGAAGGLLMQKLLARVAASGAEVRADTRCETLVLGDDGSVVGALARSGGEEVALRARRGVVLSAGGFINNKTMIATHAPRLARCKFRVGAEGDDGSGIRLGLGAGGGAAHMEMGSVSLAIVPPKSLARGLLVNRHGQRFINEDAYFGALGEAALLHQDGRAYLVLDDATFERPDVPREIAGVGDTIGELEGELGLPPGSLAATVEHYNRHASEGRDPVFRKGEDYVTPLVNPPYGALDCTTENSLYAVFTLGGLETDADGRVLSPDGRVVPQLYAAGRTSAAISAPGYSSGLSIGDGTFFGRRAGRHAAANAGG